MNRPSTLAVSALLLACPPIAIAALAVPAPWQTVRAAELADVPGETMGEPVFEDAPTVPVFTWTGAYAGAQLGYAFGRDRIAAALPTGALRLGLSPESVVGGGHVGYLLSTQSLPALGRTFAGADTAFVGGLEGDVDGLRLRDHARRLPAIGGVATLSEVEGSIRGRVGVASRRVLVYATGGIAFAGYDTTAGTDHASRTRIGSTVGGGIEYAILNTVSVRAEYRYSDFGHSADLTTGGGAVATVDHHDTVQRLQAGVSYRFGSPATAAP